MAHEPVRDRRAGRAGRNRPEVLVYHHPAAAARACLRQVGAGLEEEGIPFRVGEAEGGTAALAYAAAQASPLSVGVGVGAAGDLCVHQAKLPPGSPALSGPRETARAMGHNAARLVTGLPFKEVTGRDCRG
jgi:hypothetical protein